MLAFHHHATVRLCNRVSSVSKVLSSKSVDHSLFSSSQHRNWNQLIVVQQVRPLNPFVNNAHALKFPPLLFRSPRQSFPPTFFTHLHLHTPLILTLYSLKNLFVSGSPSNLISFHIQVSAVYSLKGFILLASHFYSTCILPSLVQTPSPFSLLAYPRCVGSFDRCTHFFCYFSKCPFFVCVYPVECLKKTPTLQLTSLPSTPWSFFCNLCLVFALSHILNFQMSVLCMFLLPSPFFLGPPYAAAPKGVHLGALRGCKRWWDATSTSYSQGVENTIPHCWFTLKALTPHPLTSLPFFIAPKLPQNLSELLLPLNTRPTPTCSSCPLSDYICMPLPRKRVCEKGGRLHLLSPVFGCKFRAEERLDGTKNKCTGVEKREKIKGG